MLFYLFTYYVTSFLFLYVNYENPNVIFNTWRWQLFACQNIFKFLKEKMCFSTMQILDFSFTISSKILQIHCTPVLLSMVFWNFTLNQPSKKIRKKNCKILLYRAHPWFLRLFFRNGVSVRHWHLEGASLEYKLITKGLHFRGTGHCNCKACCGYYTPL